MDLLKDISPAQWAMLALGVVFVGLSFKSEVSKVLSSFAIKKKEADIKLTALVGKWERLRDACHDAGLHNACSKLDEVFPMLVEVNDE
jgi:predicted oxidoreductase